MNGALENIASICTDVQSISNELSHPETTSKYNLHVYQFNESRSTLRTCMHVSTCLWTESENLRSAKWRFPHGAFCLCVFKNNHQLIAPFCAPWRPFIWQPHLFPLCWLIAPLLPFSRKHMWESERDGKKERCEIYSPFTWYLSQWRSWQWDEDWGTLSKVLVHFVQTWKSIRVRVRVRVTLKQGSSNIQFQIS